MFEILHLFPNLMNMYGDYANIRILSHYMNEEGFAHTVSAADDFISLDGTSLLYMGCGTERSSLRALEILSPRKNEIKKYLENGGMLLLTGNAMEIFGRRISDDRYGDVDGLGIFDYTVSRTHNTRYLGDVIYSFNGMKIMGFINKCSENDIKDGYLFETCGERGNTKDSIGEGFYRNNVFATSLLGPVMIKNPDFCRFFMDKIYGAAGFVPDRKADMSEQRDAFDAAYAELCELRKRMK